MKIYSRNVAKAVGPALVLMLTLIPALAKTKQLRFHTVYVGAMGSTDEAERFRILLQGELSKQGFMVLDDATKADVSLSGILVVRVYDDNSLARATVGFRTPDGVLTKDFEPHFGGGHDTVSRRAQDVAKFLVKLAEGSPVR